MRLWEQIWAAAMLAAVLLVFFLAAAIGTRVALYQKDKIRGYYNSTSNSAGRPPAACAENSVSSVSRAAHADVSNAVFPGSCVAGRNDEKSAAPIAGGFADR